MKVKKSSEASDVPLLTYGDDFVRGQRSEGGLNQTKRNYQLPKALECHNPLTWHQGLMENSS